MSTSSKRPPIDFSYVPGLNQTQAIILCTEEIIRLILGEWKCPATSLIHHLDVLKNGENCTEK